MDGGCAADVGLWQLVQLFAVRGPRSNVVLFATMMTLSLTNVFVGSYAAAPILGAFYQTLLERDLPAFGANCRAAIFLSLILSVLTATVQFISDVLAVRWRVQLTQHLHSGYLNSDYLAFCWLARADCEREDTGPGSPPSGGAERAAPATPRQRCAPETGDQAWSPAPCPGASLTLPHVDNPDQRIVADAKLLCDTLADTAKKMISAPFMIFINGVFSIHAVGWIAPVSISLYFVLGLAINHLLATAVSSVVTRHQQLEGDLRAQHRWLCSRALDVGLCGGASAAEHMVEDGLEQALGMQLVVALRRWSLNAAAEVQMRLSAVINYGSVAVAVFTIGNSFWVWGASEPMSQLNGPSLTAAISRASFYTLAICEGWSDLVKASVQFGDIRGYVSRVRQLLVLIRRFRPGPVCVARHDQRDCEESSEARAVSRNGDEHTAGSAAGQCTFVRGSTRPVSEDQGTMRRDVLLRTDRLPWTGAVCTSKDSCGVVMRARALSPRGCGEPCDAVGMDVARPATLSNGHGIFDGSAGAANGSNAGMDRRGQHLLPAVPREHGSPNIELSEVCVWSPCGTVLVDRLSVVFRRGEPMLITGPNGCGKSTLVSVLGGLCPHFSGTVTLPPRSRDIIILPQRPVLAPGSLADLVRYPDPAQQHQLASAAPASRRHDVFWQRSMRSFAALPGLRHAVQWLESPTPPIFAGYPGTDRVGAGSAGAFAHAGDGSLTDGASDAQHAQHACTSYSSGGSGVRAECYHAADAEVHDNVTDSEALECLRAVGLGYLLGSFPARGLRAEWDRILSPGEQQRLLFARLLLRRPAFAILDESTRCSAARGSRAQ